MATFIKAGFWEKLCKPCKGYKGWLNLDELIKSLAPPPPEPAYRVYTALLTQSGGNVPRETSNGSTLYKGVTYIINENPDNYDLTQYGAPNNNVGTSFVCTIDGIDLPDAPFIQLFSNDGAPVVTVLENTIGNIWFTFNSDGFYYVNSDGLFIVNKTWTTPTNNDNGSIQFQMFRISDNQCIIYDSSTSNNGMSNTSIEIRVYS